jgi:proliferating cell nuclear antigen
MAAAQTRFFAEPSGESVEITTSGRAIRPLVAIPATLADEAKLSFDADGLYSRLVDPANVGLCEISATPAAFEEYILTGEELTVGTNLDTLQSALSDARLGTRTDDPVALDVDATRTLVEIEREYETTTLSKTDEMLNLDPEAVRPWPDPPELTLSYEASLDVQAFVDAVAYVGTDHVRVMERDGRLLFGGKRGPDEDGSEFETLVDLGDVAEPTRDEPTEGASSIFSMSYLSDLATGLKQGKVTSLTVRWGDEFPLFLEFERRTGDELLYEGQYMLAPRVESGGDD